MYTLTITEKQAQVIQQALEVFSRLGIGQVRMALEELPLRKDQMISCEDEREIERILSAYIVTNNSMGNAKTPESSKVAWDIYQVIRHRLSWEYAVKMGHVKSLDDKRCMKTMWGVNYDEPFKTSVEPLAKIN